MKPQLKAAIISVLIILFTTVAEAQPKTQAKKLLDALMERNHKNALTAAQDIDNVNYVEKNGASLLIASAESGYSDVCKILLAKGASIDFQSPNGTTALYIASQDGRTEVAKLLLENGAHPDLPANNGATALIVASEFGHPEIVNLLLDNNAKADLQDNEGRISTDCGITEWIQRYCQIFAGC